MIAELEALKRLLREEWDPIGLNGFGPADEYDNYALHIFGMLKAGKGEREIAGYLSRAAIEKMGLPDAGDCPAIAHKIIKIHEEHA